ncbi:hypothetical protein [Uliginosibacterium sp. 31-12]|uniref:hypothetical protein n=1 Tax=Uliginosibacterium sp. 31-12 TaxID=3062781 RepID=UPI0026E2039D|nr:hypothetical protein [Uliginosibacterium sp. 31-12]MDO6385584.1 hypothetical protein [Uliginosibacterium sp. 31-12]
MARINSLYASGQLQAPTNASGGVECHVRAEIALAAAVASGDVLAFLPLPAGYVVTDWALDNDDCDTGTTLAADLGLLTAAGTAISSAAADGGKWKSATTALQAAAVTRNSAGSAAEQTALARMASASSDRMIALVATAAGTGGVGAKIGLTVWLKSV